jgi:hypothetical protein
MADDEKGGDDDMMLFCVLLSGKIFNRIVGKEVTPLLDFSHHSCHDVNCTYCRNC